MLNQKLFNLVAQRTFGMAGLRVSRDLEIPLIELMMVDITAKLLEKKIRQGLGLFGPIRSPKRDRREEKRHAMLMEDFRCTISDTGRYGPPSPVITVNVNEPNEKWEIGEFYIEQRGTGISFKNIGFVPEPPAEETSDEKPQRSGAWHEKGSNGGYVEFREGDFDPLHLEHFIRMYDEAVGEVLHMSIPLDTTRKVKQFQNGQVVYNLGEAHRMRAAGIVLAQGLNVITAQGDLTDLRIMNLTTRVSSLDFSGFYGNEVEWLEAHSKEGRNRARGEFQEREWGDATDEQALYIEDMLSRLRNLG